MSAPASRHAARTHVLRQGPARLFVREIGAGPPIVVIHGGPDFDHTYFLPELDALASTHRLVYYDQRGRGRSFHGEGPDDVTVESELDDLDRVCAWTGAESVALLGHSWGGVLAMEYAVSRPSRLSHLILLGSGPPSHDGLIRFREFLATRRTPAEQERMEEIRREPAYRAGDPEVEAELYRIHFRPALHRPDDVDRVVRRLRTQFTPQGVVAARAIEDRLYDLTWRREDYDLSEGLARLAMPALVIHGSDDFLPLETARSIATAIPSARLAVIEECGHFAYLEQPERFRSLVFDFLGTA